MKILGCYLAIMNIVTFIMFASDKIAAIKNRMRIRVATLLGLCAVGGSLGGLIAMYMFRHKTRKVAFTVGVPLMLVVQVLLALMLLNFM